MQKGNVWHSESSLHKGQSALNLKENWCNYYVFVKLDIQSLKKLLKITYFGGTFFLGPPDISPVVLSEEGDESSIFFAAFSANFKPFTSITVTKSPAWEAGRAFTEFDGLFCSELPVMIILPKLI